ncbi:MAG: hypothetical protein KGI08_09675, partial [Thaumarchaeota archaeon]|nr:hypothetical protein [Nitrososphaerota archaeon]
MPSSIGEPLKEILLDPATIAITGMPIAEFEGLQSASKQIHIELGNIAKSQESIANGLIPTAPENILTAESNLAAIKNAEEKLTGEVKTVAPVEIPAPDIHQLARSFDRQTFDRVQELQKDLAWSSNIYREVAEKRPVVEPDATLLAKLDEQVKPLQERVDAILGKVGGVEDKLTNKKAEEIASLRNQINDINTQRQAEIDRAETASKAETGDMQRLRTRMEAINKELGEIGASGKLREAYRQAAEKMQKELHKPQVYPTKEELPIAKPEKLPEEKISAEREQKQLKRQKDLKDIDKKIDYHKSMAEQARNRGEEEKAASHESKLDDLSKKSDALRKEFEDEKRAIAKEQEVKQSEIAAANKAKLEEENRQFQEARLQAIKRDIINQAVKAGYGQEEAVASAEILARQYGYMANMYGAEIGELYSQLGARIASSKSEIFSGKYTKETRVIKLSKIANPSTLIHEGAHHFFNMMEELGSLDGAPQQLKDDFAMVKEWMGVEEGKKIQGKHEEQFARGFEKYLMEGRAPSKVLANVFAKFAEWLQQLYSGFKKLNLDKDLSPEMRDFFDRTLTGLAE